MDPVEAANLSAGWVSCVATIVGLSAVYKAVKRTEAPRGPIPVACLADSFCGHEIVYLTPTPTRYPDKGLANPLFGVMHLTETRAPEKSKGAFADAPATTTVTTSSTFKPGQLQRIKTKTLFGDDESEIGLSSLRTNSSLQTIVRWDTLPWHPHILLAGSQAVPSNSPAFRSCIAISRATLLTMLAVSSMRLMQRLRGPSGLRYVYRGYIGIFTVDWPLGGNATVQFNLLDTRTSQKDVYPRGFYRSVRHAINMMCGCIDDGKAFRVHVSGRRKKGTYRMDYLVKGLNGCVAARDLYDMMGGDVYAVDLLSLVLITESTDVDSGSMTLQLPALGEESSAATTVHIGPSVINILAELMDKIPWTQLAWPMHRGLKDVIVAYGKPMWRAYRRALANTLRRTVIGREEQLIKQGWDQRFVYETLADLVADAALREGGSLTRAVTSVALLLWENCDTNDPRLHETQFWRNHVGPKAEEVDPDVMLDVDTVVALSKLYTVHASYEFDYGVHYDFPTQLLLY
ncbi:hypothetical protein BDY21DRAFT_365953 [Lineolata rhizophorae]|uniref:Uncharacterized protein n=1 Tax=Lineolata rhizophorae TaxID=578093 RepID=A0A6A6NT54_9PEZI|nr:hypothetical protein BDY21DRAFT_365953 [Lineolata rhizophorae]